MQKDVVIAGYARSPYHFAHKGELARVRPDELAAQVVRGLLEKTGVEPADIEDLIMGCAFPEGEQGLNVARIVGFLAELPQSVAGTTVNRFCGSSMQAIHMAAGAIQMDAGEAFICAGVESMTRVPATGFNPMLHPGLAERYPQAYISMGETAENLAEQIRASPATGRRPWRSRATNAPAPRARRASSTTNWCPIEQGNLRVEADGCIRPGTSLEALADLKPAFKADGSVTAGTSSPLTDGATAVLVTSKDYAKAHGLAPLARIRSVAVAGCAAGDHGHRPGGRVPQGPRAGRRRR